MPLVRWLVTRAVPLALVLASVVLLFAASVALVTDTLPLDGRLALAGGGVAAWILGIGWGVVVNAQPMRPAAA